MYECYGILWGLYLILICDIDYSLNMGLLEVYVQYIEEQIIQVFQYLEEKFQNGVVLKEVNVDCYVINYDEVIILLSVEWLCVKYGGSVFIGLVLYGDNDGWGGSLLGGIMGQQGFFGCILFVGFFV